jgi:hypothetical protein
LPGGRRHTRFIGIEFLPVTEEYGMVAFLNLGAPELLVIALVFGSVIAVPLAAVLLVLYFVVWRQKPGGPGPAASPPEARPRGKGPAE